MIEYLVIVYDENYNPTSYIHGSAQEDNYLSEAHKKVTQRSDHHHYQVYKLMISRGNLP